MVSGNYRPRNLYLAGTATVGGILDFAGGVVVGDKIHLAGVNYTIGIQPSKMVFQRRYGYVFQLDKGRCNRN